MEEYLVKRTFDVMDMFDELSDGDKREFLHEAIRNLDYDDSYEVARNAVIMLDSYQQCKLLEEALDEIDEDDARVGIVAGLIDKLSHEQQEELNSKLNGKD